MKNKNRDRLRQTKGGAKQLTPGEKRKKNSRSGKPSHPQQNQGEKEVRLAARLISRITYRAEGNPTCRYGNDARASRDPFVFVLERQSERRDSLEEAEPVCFLFPLHCFCFCVKISNWRRQPPAFLSSLIPTRRRVQCSRAPRPSRVPLSHDKQLVHVSQTKGKSIQGHFHVVLTPRPCT